MASDIAAERDLRSALSPGFHNKGFKTFHSVCLYHSVLQPVPVHSYSWEEKVFPLLRITVGHNVGFIIVACIVIVVHWIT